MRTELDRRMDAAVAALTGPNGPLPLGTIERWGTALPVITAAPPSLPAYWAHWCAQHRDATFLVSGEERLTFGEVWHAARRVAHALVARGLTPGERVGIAARNSPAWIATYMGVIMAGGIATLLNGWWQADELASALALTDCSLIVADAPRAARIGMVAVPVVVLDDAQRLASTIAPLVDATGDGLLPVLGPDDLATILFTSGSTGRAKGAASDHRALLQAVHSFLAQTLTMRAIAAQDGQTPSDSPATLLNLPLFHVTAQVPVFLQSFALGRRVVLMHRWDAQEAMRLIAAERITYFVGVPLMSYELLNHPARAEYDLSTVTDISAGGAARPAAHVRRLHAEMGGPAPLIGYGLTETNAVGANNWRSNYLAKPASTGRPAQPLVDLAILDEAGARLPQGTRGEVAIRSAANFREYWRDPEATAAAFTPDGYVRTGDVGYLDADGYLFVVDRIKDIIIRGGENIGCQEVEAALYAHPGVREAAVFALPDERLGEIAGAVVLADAPLDAATLRAFLAERLAAFKVPARIWFAAGPLPRMGTEKIDKRALETRYRNAPPPD